MFRPHLTRVARPLSFVAAFLVLGACNAPLTETSYPEQDVLSVEGEDYLVRSRFDPIQRAWYTDVLPVLGPQAAMEKEDAVRLVEEVWGPRVCEGEPLRVENRIYSVLGEAEAVTQYTTRGGWQIIADCNGRYL
ncbi:MAG: hypothetical protein AAGC57_15380 [Pseudomonadota bacterium]